jgi:hypothetical protein
MEFKKFTILNINEAHQIQEEIDIVINTSHIVSIKPIKMTTPDMRVVDGFWIRLSNGKKYKAVRIPEFIKNVLSENLPSAKYDDSESLQDQFH